MIADFASWFRTAHGHPPHPWQVALATSEAPGHRLIRVPTGFGKTLGVLSAWLYHGVTLHDPRWPRRLVWVLPMRTLVEQTAREAAGVLTRLGLLWDGEGDHAGKVGVHVLMGDMDAGDWHNHPLEHAVLIGTQDMVLSRALNRGYGAARARWPIDFGLLSQDTLWVLDEIQLMGIGFATALQLTAFRQQDADALPSPAPRPTWTWAMSATLQRAWLGRSVDTQTLQAHFVDVNLGAEDRHLPLWSGARKPVTLAPPEPAAAQAARILAGHAELPSTGALTLVVVNTVRRAVELHAALRRRTETVPVALIHSRFRGHERAAWATLLQPQDPATPSRILVATQVIEAGVDLSADRLYSELCPWPSLVQRAGRLARRGGEGRLVVLDLDLDRKDAAPPYDPDALSAARDALARTEDLSPRALEALEEQLRQEDPAVLQALYPYDPEHLLLREEIDELFDTTPDLSGGDLDISRYIREGDERDLSLAWVRIERDARGRSLPPSPALRPTREALCAAPFLEVRAWLCGRKEEQRRLEPGVAAFIWDYTEGAWRLAWRADLRPGAVVLLDATQGGYDPVRGLDPASRAPVPVVGLRDADAQERADSAEDQEDLSQLPASWAAWQTIGFHGARVADPLGDLPGALGRLLSLAARWHDLGKAHPAFQGAIVGAGRPHRPDLAKAPEGAWRHGAAMYQLEADGRIELRRGFRHELASALALFDVLRSHAPPEHPSRLGPLAEAVEGAPPCSDAAPNLLEREILALSAEEFDLVAYLVLSHHGKLRARMHASAADQEAPVREGGMPIRGIYPGDRLPEVLLTDAEGAHCPCPARALTLEPAALGLSRETGRSWTERVTALQARWGPFALAWMEAVFRAADVRASRDPALVDPALVEVSR